MGKREEGKFYQRSHLDFLTQFKFTETTGTFTEMIVKSIELATAVRAADEHRDLSC